jgi:hypothetical protein
MKGQVDISCEPYCINTWNYWCKKNNVDLIVLREPLMDTNYMKPTWQRWYVWDVLQSNGMSYDKVALVDVDTMVKWDSPNFFENINLNEMGVCVDNDNIGWVVQSIQGYSELFTDTKLDWTEYFNCGFVVMGSGCVNLCKNIISFWEKNQKKLVYLQDTLRKGTDQTPVNYLCKKMGNIKYLNKKWNLTHLNRKEILNNAMFVNCGYVWHFNGFDKSARKVIMEQTWDLIKVNYEN